jgi:hypothetical protein
MSRSHGLRYGLHLLILAAAVPGISWAADNGIYLGGSYGEVSSDYALSFGQGREVDDHGFKAIVGARPFDWLAIEANYADLGETRSPLFIVCVTVPCPDEETVDAQSLSVSVLGMWALPLVDLYARVGASRWETQHQIRFLPEQKLEGTDPTYGVGLQGRLGGFALRVEYERFDFGGEDADLVSAGFTYTFL